MDHLRLEILTIELGEQETQVGTVDHGTHARVRIAVNGRDLRSMVGELEVIASKTSGRPGPAGAYHYLSGYRFPAGVFEGDPEDADLRTEDRVALMGCDCGEVGCWPFLVSITQDAGCVVWSRFRQPHRPSWSYDALGPFRFDAEDYFQAIARARAEFEAVARLPDELAAARAAIMRADIARYVEIQEGILTGWHRRDELDRPSPEDLAQLRSDSELRAAAADEVVRRLGCTHGQGMAIAMLDMQALDASELAARKTFLADLRALAHVPDNAVVDAYNAAAQRMNSRLR